MKKLLYTFLAVSILFSACKKEDNNTNNPFSGDWSGGYSGGESGVWQGTVTSNGNLINGVITSDAGDIYFGTGSVSNSGTFDLVIGSVTTGAVFSGNASGNTVTGTWENLSDSLQGNWSGNKH